MAAKRSNRRTSVADPRTESGSVAVPSPRAYDSDKRLWGIKQLSVFDRGLGNEIPIDKIGGSRPAEAGHRLRQARREVLADTIVKGLVDLTPSDMVIRAVTRVQPGTHLAMQNEYRRLLKEVLDERQAKPVALAA